MHVLVVVQMCWDLPTEGPATVRPVLACALWTRSLSTIGSLGLGGSVDVMASLAARREVVPLVIIARSRGWCGALGQGGGWTYIPG